MVKRMIGSSESVPSSSCFNHLETRMKINVSISLFVSIDWEFPTLERLPLVVIVRLAFLRARSNGLFRSKGEWHLVTQVKRWHPFPEGSISESDG